MLIGFIRHAPTAWNAEGRLQGRSDIPLSEEGRRSYADRRPPAPLADATWFASPLSRALQTAAVLGVRAPATDPRLVELDFGTLEGLTIAEVKAQEPETLRHMREAGDHMRPGGGETPLEMKARLAGWLAEVAGAHRVVGVVAHMGIIRAAMALAEDWPVMGAPPVEVDWTAAHLFDADPAGGLTTRALNVPLEVVGAN